MRIGDFRKGPLAPPPPDETAPAGAAPLPDYEEAYFGSVALGDLATLGADYSGIKVYSTKKPRRSIEVIVSVNRNFWSTNNGASLGIQVFGVTNGVRALVASGRYSAADFLDGTQQRKLIAYEGLAQQYDVELSMARSNNTVADTVGVAVIASDRPCRSSDDRFVGVIAMGDYIAGASAHGKLTGLQDIQVPAEVPLELVGVTGVVDVNASANVPLWLNIHDVAIGGVPAGQRAVFSIPLPDSTNQIFEAPVEFSDLFRRRRFTLGMVACISTTAGITALVGAPNAAYWNVFYR